MKIIKDKIFTCTISILSWLSVILLFLVIYFILRESSGFFENQNLKSLILNDTWRPLSNNAQFGILNILLGTIYISLLSILIALPVALGSSIYISCFMSNKLKNFAHTFINLLAGIPSVIYGFIGLVVLIPYIERTFALSSGESVLAGSIVLAVMILPFIINSCEESMSKIKNKNMTSSDALGINREYMIMSLIIPSSIKPIIISSILGLSRAMGETMAVMMVIGNAPISPKLLGKSETIASLIALEMGTAQIESMHYYSLFASGMTLMVMLLTINIIFQILNNYFSKIY